MADLLPNKLLHFSFSSPRFPPFSFPLSRSPQAHSSIIRFAPLRHSRLCHSSSVLANLCSDSTQLEIISTAERLDGSVVFKFGDSSEKSQSFENLNGSDADTKSEVLGAVHEEYGVNLTKSELVENADGEHELKFERKSVREFPEVHKNDGAEMVSSTDNKKDENHSSEIVHFLDSKVDKNYGGEEERSTSSKVELKETVLNSITQAGELVGSPGSSTDLQSGAQSYGDYIEDERNHNLISTVELENPSDSKMAKHDVGTNVITTISDSTVDLVRENSNESGMAKRDGGIDTLVTNSDSPANLIMEKFEETYNELVAAVSTCHLGLEGGKLLEISEKSSGVKTSERPVSLEDNGIGSNVKHVANEEDDDMLEIAETKSPIEASDLAVSLEDNELDISVNQVVNEEDDDNKFQELVGVNSLIEASDKAVSLEDDELDSDVKQVAIEEDDDNKLQGIVDMNSIIEISDTALSLEDDKLDSSPKQVADVENVDNKLRVIANVDSLVEASYMAVSVEGDELKGNQKQMATEEDDDRKLQESTDVNSFAETSKTAVSLEDDTLQSSMEQATNEEGGDNKLEEFAGMTSLGEAVSLEDSQLDSNEKHLMNEDDDGWVELMEKPAQLEAEPILDEDASSDSPDEVVASESTSGLNMVNDAAPAIIPQSHDDLRGLDHSEAGKPEASAIALEEANVYSVNSEQMAMPTLHLSSAAASLPHSSEALTGGEDAYFVCQNWFGVADGVGQWSFRGTDQAMYAQELMQNCENLVLNSRSAGLTNIKEVLQQIAAATESTGSARVLVAHFDNQVLHVANIGDTGFVIIRNGGIFKKSSPMVHEFSFPCAIGAGVDPLEAVEEYNIELQDGDVIVAATDGLFDNLYDQEIASIVSKSVVAEMEPKEVAELLTTKAQEVGSSAYGRTPFSDAAQAAGHIGIIGGKLDHVTVVVSLVQSR